jgi:uroporphyrinogen decarboxylase
MNSRECVLAALNHREPDRPPRDLGSTTATGIHPNAYRALKRHLGLDDSWRYLSARAQLAFVEAPIVERFGIDLLPLIPESAAVAPALDEHRAYVDRWGIERRLPEDGGHYYVSRPPLANATSIGDLRAFELPQPREDFRALAEQARRLRATSDKALVLNPEVGFMHQSQFLRSFDQWLMDLVADPPFAAALMDRALDVWLAETAAMLRDVGKYADIVIYADDLAFQDRPMASRRTFDQLLKPRLRRVFDLLKSSGLKVLYHTCGNVWSLIDEFIELGVDALNPVQVSAGEMGNTAELKRRWGDRLTFWGGIDTQRVMSSGTPDDVRAEVRRRINDLARAGGYVLATVHDIQAEVPPENVCAMFDGVNEFQRINEY